MELTLSLGQMKIVPGDEETNFTKARQMAVEAKRRGSSLLLLPELWSSGGATRENLSMANRMGSGVFAKLADLAKETQLHILGSNLCLLDGGKAGNTFTWFTPQGQLLASYSKVHLFGLMEEDRYLMRGDHLSLVNSPWGKAGLSICYDLRFAEMFRAYALEGAVMAFVPAGWPHPRLAHWQTLLRARAIENQFYVIACNQVGLVKSTQFFGHSCVIDPWGETLIEAGEAEMLLTISINLDVVEQVRAKIPVFADRVPDAYGIVTF